MFCLFLLQVELVPRTELQALGWIKGYLQNFRRLLMFLK